MILEELVLKNFRSHKNTRVKFNEGITVIVGDNGSGKTSILEAVGYALFRETPSRVKIDELVRRGGEKEGMQVSLTFNIDGRRYKVIRTYADGRSGAVLYDGKGGIISTGEKNRQTTKEIEKRVRMDSKLFTNAIYIRQGQIDDLLTADARERKELLGKLIGTQELEKAFTNMREILGEYMLKSQRYRDVPEAIKETETKIRQGRIEIEELRENAVKVDSKLREANAKKIGKEKEAEALERLINLEKELRLKEQELETNKRRLREIEENEKILSATEGSKKRYEEIRESIRKLEKRIAALEEVRKTVLRLRRELEEKEKKATHLKEVVEGGLRDGSSLLGREIRDPIALEVELSKEKKRLEKRLDKLHKAMNELERRIGELKGINREIEEALKELQGVQERCPVCLRPMTREHRDKVVKDYQESLSHNKVKIGQMQEEMEKLANERGGCLERLQMSQAINIGVVKNASMELEALKEKVRELKREIGEKEKDVHRIAELKKSLQDKREEKNSLRVDYERYIAAVGFLRKNAPEKDDIKKRIQDITDNIQKLKEEISSSGVAPDIEKLESVRNEIRSLYNVITALSTEKSAIEAEAREKGKILMDLTQRLDELELKKEEGLKVQEFIELLNKIRGLFHKDNLQKKLRARAKPLIERHTRDEFQKFHLPYSDISLTDDFEITLYGPEGGVRMDMLSGGERIAAALALRIGIAKALAGAAMELLMLDEPTIHLDAIRRRELVDIIKNLTSLPQTIVVTHDKEFEGAADKLLEVEKTDGISTVDG